MKLFSCKNSLPFTKREGWPAGAAGPEEEALLHTGLFPGLDVQWSLPRGILKLLGTGDSFSLPLSPFLNGSVYNCYSLPAPPLFLGVENLFSSFTGLQIEGNSTPGWKDHAESHPHLVQMT